jgi:ribosomal protein S12 methylthiotransferase accessory factor
MSSPIRAHAPAAEAVPALLDGTPDGEDDTEELVASLLRSRSRYGITRVGSVTGLDRVGIPVVQVVRPQALSNVVVQGKGMTPVEAAASALMEALETWAAEQAPRTRVCEAAALGQEIEKLYAGAALPEARQDWHGLPLPWVGGWDLVSGRVLPVPAPLVDTIYTWPAPYPAVFPRSTSGLAAGRSLARAVRHGVLELLEREAVAAARTSPRVFDERQISPRAVAGPRATEVLDRIAAAGLVTGAWLAHAPHSLPVYWCHVMEAGPGAELVPLPSEGFGCGFTHDDALARALLEACQARLTAISGAREDITRAFYPDTFDREQLADWRNGLTRPPRTLVPPVLGATPPSLTKAVAAACAAGAQAVAVVPLHVDLSARIFVVRVVAPPLRQGDGA